jgi:hypothetical protein
MSVLKRSRARLAIVGAGILLVVVGIAIFWWRPRGQVSYLFDLKDVPWSVRWVHCKDIFTSDILLTCAFRIDAKDFPALLSNEKFSQVATEYQHVHEFPMSLNLGEDFAPAFHYSAVPKGADHGGMIDVFTDSSKTKVLAHLYIE